MANNQAKKQSVGGLQTIFSIECQRQKDFPRSHDGSVEFHFPNTWKKPRKAEGSRIVLGKGVEG